MIKTFTVCDVQHTRISSSKGSMSWWLSDEEGTNRRVNAISDIAADGVIGEVRAVYEQESDLVEHLQYVEKGETFRVVFSSSNQQKNYVPREVYNKRPVNNKTDKLAREIGQFAVVAGLLLILWVAYDLFANTTQVPSNMASITN